MEPIDLFKEPKQFLNLPGSVKNAIYFLVAAWAGNFLFLWQYFQIFRDQIPQSEASHQMLTQVALAAITLYALIRLKNWARVLCMVCNIMPMLKYIQLTLALASTDHTSMLLLSIAVFLAFGGATFFLSRPASAAFFKAQSPPPPPREDG